MHSFGIVLLVLSVLALFYALIQKRQATKIAGAPFHRTGELATNPALGTTGKGLVSAEGMAQPHAPFYAPCSGQPCVYFEVKVERLWEKEVKSESGYKTERGSTTVRTDKAGTTFLLNDSSGPVMVDAREAVTAPMKETFEQVQNVMYGDVAFGQYRTSVPMHSGNERSLGIKVTEKIFAPTVQIFTMGKLVNGAITRTDGLLGGLEFHEGGREHVLGKTAKNAKRGFIAAAAMFVPGIVGALFFSAAPSTAADADSCTAGITDVTAPTCNDRLYTDEGKSTPWKVTRAGTYDVKVTTPASSKIALNPATTVKDQTGAVVFSGDDNLAHAMVPGSYTILVRDQTKGRAATMSGGFGYTVKVTSKPDAAPAVASAPAAATPWAAVASDTNTHAASDHAVPATASKGKHGKH